VEIEIEMLEAKDLHKTYKLPHKTVDVLKGASIAVGEGERVAIVGRSGAGKSTLLHVLGGLDRPGSGEVMVDGRSLYEMSRRKRTAVRAARIGFVFQSYHLLPEMDVTENVMLPAMTGVLNLSRSEMRERALALLDRVGLADRATHMPMELSGGEQQRVALARALVNKPALVLADEPTGNLDSKTGSQVMNLLFDLSNTNKSALVMVTHSLESAKLCDRVLEIRDGLLVDA
jgi:ABC-type lipoprotein export system ATPase subunit